VVRALCVGCYSYIFLQRLFSRPPSKDVVYQCHASFINSFFGDWRTNLKKSKMNEHVQKFIDRRKKEVDEERKKLLAKIPEFQIREYSTHQNINEEYPLWDAAKNQSYKISAIDVSEDDFEVMKKYLLQDDEAKTENEGMVKPSNAADKTLSIFAIICLIMAFIGLIVGFVGLDEVSFSWWNPTLSIVGFSAFVVLFGEWAILRLLVNISVRLRQINNNLNKTL